MTQESLVNYYAKTFPGMFNYAENEIVYDNQGREYIDFFSGAGALNYGHNPNNIKQVLVKFLEENRILHCMDMNTEIKQLFMERFNSIILKPRGLDYKFQFTGPTGTNAVEAAIKLARIYTKRKTVISFTNSFHGMTAMSLALSGTREQSQTYNSLQNVTYFPFEGFFEKEFNSIEYLRKMILLKGSGIELPAAIILEKIQGEGGVNVASDKWLRELREFTSEHGIVLIIDDIQVGCGRTGNFFSFERANIKPDIVLLSKSLSGYGLPLSLVLLDPTIDVWNPGEHNGTFRANNLSLCAAAEALNFWDNPDFITNIQYRSQLMEEKLKEVSELSPIIVDVRGVGMIWGIELKSKEISKAITKELFNSGIFIETCGVDDKVLKLLPPLNISKDKLIQGLDVVGNVLLKEEIYENIES